MFTVTNVSTKAPTNDEWAALLNQIAALAESDQRAVYGALQEAVAPLVKGKTIQNKISIDNDNDAGARKFGFKLPKGD